MGASISEAPLYQTPLIDPLPGEASSFGEAFGGYQSPFAPPQSNEAQLGYDLAPAVLLGVSLISRNPVATAPRALGHLRIGHTVPWADMTKAQRRAFQHSYSRHGTELGLPKWKQGNAEALRGQFNSVVGHIRETGTHLGTRIKPFNGRSVRVNYFESNIQGTKYYYYETMSGQFVSAGKAR
ncbi:hypothetical protein ACL7TT_07160 [Microbulbifer sp. 2304DJ12-6]|uniref:hypothetical protein n=1 Tax=Microbulbifer sp. 2304DJ12-6 TaxID=3233340 RepID=UPI0039AF2EE5